MFLLCLAACGGGVLLVGSTLGQLVTPSSASGSPSLPRATSLDQLALNLYLGLKQNEIEARSPGSGDVQFKVENGDTPATIGVRLQKAGMIQDPELFRLLVRARGVESNLQAGEYTLKKGMTMDEVLVALQHGREKPNNVTVVEGRRVEEVAESLEKQNAAKRADFLSAAKMNSAYTQPELSGRPSNSTLEGYLFPDTYDVPKDATPQQLVQLMLSNFDKKVGKDLWGKPPQGLTPYQTLIIASIVEREAQVASERPIIASVYENRIKKGMR
ncbi:MAG: endolytic transglycosylase MltG, partial [Chloroflexi bacterium]|nr:endolytic transglycosylase MltG [Chloroflexota bacterium]